MSDVLERIRDAVNAHDPERLAAVFADDYRSAQPIHPNRGFDGRAQVLANWTSVFEGVDEFQATLLSSAGDELVRWGEWDWRGRYTDGASFAMRGVTIFTVRDDLIIAGRLYMELVDEVGGDIDAAVQELYRPPAKTST
jgi:ketosteroid isomerase-like protein